MKKYLIVFGIIPFLFACNQKKVNELESQVETLSSENAEFTRVMTERDEQLNDYFATMNEVESNLEEIKKHEGIISTNLSGEGTNQKENIVASIETLNNLIQKNKTLVGDLDKKYKNANFKIKELDKMISELNEQITNKENELMALKTELEKSNYQIASLTTELGTVSAANERLQEENMQKGEIISKQTTDLNTAYYIIGTDKDLKAKNVITKEGGFIGIGKTDNLATDFDASAFTKIDIRNFKELKIDNKSAKVVTTHPTDSYELIENGKKVDALMINNPEAFWKSSKYLVVIVD
ncbi:MAG TPA: hypothetical protein VFM99_07100 [Chitinophagales bacterium]|nr:hypothetical protein [Chitinophagales bacterium]